MTTNEGAASSNEGEFQGDVKNLLLAPRADHPRVRHDFSAHEVDVCGGLAGGVAVGLQ